MTAQSKIQEGIDEIKRGLLKLQESVFPYGTLGVLTSMQQSLADELENAYLHEYTPKGEWITPVMNGKPIGTLRKKERK